jgi:hypothetical protein
MVNATPPGTLKIRKTPPRVKTITPTITGAHARHSEDQSSRGAFRALFQAAEVAEPAAARDFSVAAPVAFWMNDFCSDI